MRAVRAWGRLVAGLVLVGLCACGWVSCETPIDKERRELLEAGESTEAVIYRGLKVTLRSAPLDPEAAPPDASATKIRALTLDLITQMSGKEPETTRTAEDYVVLAKEFYELRDELRTVDEDEYPTLLAQIIAANGGAAAPPEALAWYSDDWEHLVLAMLWVAGQKTPPGFVIYELGELDPAGIQVPGVRVAARMLRSLAFLQRGWPWLTDEEATAYLADLESSRSEIIAFSHEFGAAPGSGRGAEDEFIYAQWHAPGVLVRGLARHQKELEEPALDDFDAFLTDAETLGLENEGVWLIGAYVGIKRDDSERALTNLRKLEASEQLGDNERKLVADAIKALEDRDPDAAFKSITDKVLIGKIVGGYVLRILAQVDWREELEKSDSGRALLGAGDTLGREVERIKGALSAEQLAGLKDKAGEAARRLGQEARERAGKTWEKVKNE